MPSHLFHQNDHSGRFTGILKHFSCESNALVGSSKHVSDKVVCYFSFSFYARALFLRRDYATT